MANRPKPEETISTKTRVNSVYSWVTKSGPQQPNPTRELATTTHKTRLLCRRRPTLPHPPECSTIGAGGLSFRVRNGTGRDPTANTTDKNQATTHPHHNGWAVSCQTLNNGREQKLLFNHCFCVLNVWSISTGHLHTLRCFQIRPINPIIYRGPQKKPNLGTGFPLRCFQRLSLPYVANQPCPRRDNWHTRGTSIPVLSY